jgi:hypothetical protein
VLLGVRVDTFRDQYLSPERRNVFAPRFGLAKDERRRVTVSRRLVLEHLDALRRGPWGGAYGPSGAWGRRARQAWEGLTSYDAAVKAAGGSDDAAPGRGARQRSPRRSVRAVATRSRPDLRLSWERPRRKSAHDSHNRTTPGRGPRPSRPPHPSRTTMHNDLHTWIAERQREFLDRTGLGGLLDSASVPAVYRVVPRSTLQRIATNGRAALLRLCERSGVAAREDVAVRLPVLAVAPFLAFDVMPGALGPDPRVIADARAYALAILGYNPGARLELRAGLIELFPPPGWPCLTRSPRPARQHSPSGRSRAVPRVRSMPASPWPSSRSGVAWFALPTSPSRRRSRSGLPPPRGTRGGSKIGGAAFAHRRPGANGRGEESARCLPGTRRGSWSVWRRPSSSACAQRRGRWSGRWQSWA